MSLLLVRAVVYEISQR